MDRTVMGAAIIHIGQDHVRVRREGAIGEEHRLNPAAKLIVGQEQQVFAPCRGHAYLLLHAILVLQGHYYVRLVDFPTMNG